MKKCLIVVDYQNDFVSGSLGFPEAAGLDRFIAQKIEQYRENGDEVLFTFDTHGEEYATSQEGRWLPVPHCQIGTEGHNLYGETAGQIRKTDWVFYKDTFGSDSLYTFLRATPFESIELAGLVSNICVISNAVLAKTAQPETPIFVDAKCTASHNDHLHQAALDVMIGLQIQIVNK